jgi:hypothetical protein
MKIVSKTLVIAVIVSGCAQFTTSDEELANLKNAADARADTYLDCMRTEAEGIDGTNDAAFVTQAVGARCEGSLEAYRTAQKESLSAQYMMTSKPLNASVQDLQTRGQNIVTEIMLARQTGAENPAVSARGSAVPDLRLSVGAASAAAVSQVTAWSPDQRVYLDCMDEQADKYGRLNESAEAIAAVATDRCKSYLGTERRDALEKAGKVRVMGKIMDMRLAPGR